MDLFIIAGEPSGDAQGAKLIEALLQKKPALKIGAVAGPRMRSLKIESLFPMENLQVMGFVDVLFALPKIVRQFKAIRRKIIELNPKAVLFIDYPGFNLRLQRSLRKKGYEGKLIHFVCPSVWAWGKKRIPMMEQNLDLLLALFPFEEAIFARARLPVHFVGHPLAAPIASFIPSKTFREIQRIAEGQKILSIFPGSRKKEIGRNLPLQMEAARKLAALDPSLQIAVSIAHIEFEEEIRHFAKDALLIPPQDNYELMSASHLAMATSGTVTLELALHGIPTIVNYAIKPLDCFIAQKILRINLPFYCIVNIILSKSIFPELFGPNLTEDKLFFWIQKFWFDSDSRETCLKGCSEVRKSLGVRNAALEAAGHILESGFLTPSKVN